MIRTPQMRLILEQDLHANITRVEYDAALGESFRLLVEFTLDSGVELPVAQGQEITFESDSESLLPQIRGVVIRINERLTERLHYELTIVPPLWLASMRTNRRIFHEATAVDIANLVLQDYGSTLGSFHSALVGPLAKRDYRVQAKESDLAFIARLFADDGLTHFYDHETNQWVVTDDTTTLQSSAVRVPFIEAHGLTDGGGAQRVAHVHAVSVSTSKVETAVAVRDYDFRRPATALHGKQGSGACEVYLPGRGEFTSADEGRGRASRLLQSLNSRQKVFRLRTNFLLAPGSTLKLEGAPREDANTTLLVTSSQIRFDTERVLADLFCVEAAKPWRPILPSKPCIDGVDTAVVVGAPEQVIDVDALGRILVQFHWDREKKSSCRARVGQTLSGSAFGAQFFPRIGMEVLVSYIDGDPDQPVVTGCVYNGENPTPFLLPADATRSGLRTVSIPDGKRRQEISFEDKSNAEMLHIEAARDLEEIVPEAKSVTIGGELTSSIGGDESFTVGGDSSERIAGSSRLQVGTNRAERVDGSLSTTIGADRTVTVVSDQKTSVGGTDTMTIGKAKEDGIAAWTVHGTFALSVDGDAGEISLTSGKRLRLRCGDSEIMITPDEVKISAKAITLDGKDSVVAVAKGPCLTLADDARVTAKAFEVITPKSWLKLDEKVHVVGDKISLNSEPLPNAPPPNEDGTSPKNFKIALLDLSHKPYDSIPYTLSVDSDTFEGETDEAGTVAHDVNPMARSATVTLWLDGTPGKGRKKQWQMPLNDLPAIETPEGLRRRLTSLGYLQGGKTDKQAIQAFQREHAIDPTGKADDATRAKVRSIYGV